MEVRLEKKISVNTRLGWQKRATTRPSSPLRNGVTSGKVADCRGALGSPFSFEVDGMMRREGHLRVKEAADPDQRREAALRHV